MRRAWLIPACVLGLSSVAGGVVATRKVEAEPMQANAPAASGDDQAKVTKVGIWQPPSGLKQVLIWPNGAPDMEGASQPAESVLIAQTPNAIGNTTSEAVLT